MKDFFIAITLFSLLVAIIICNSIYVKNEVSILRDAVRGIPSIDSPDCQLFINSLRTKWRDFKKIARLSLNYAEINKMDCLIEELDCHLETKNGNDFENAKVMMMNILSEIVRLEEISVDGIF